MSGLKIFISFNPTLLTLLLFTTLLTLTITIEADIHDDQLEDVHIYVFRFVTKLPAMDAVLRLGKRNMELLMKALRRIRGIGCNIARIASSPKVMRDLTR